MIGKNFSNGWKTSAPPGASLAGFEDGSAVPVRAVDDVDGPLLQAEHPVLDEPLAVLQLVGAPPPRAFRFPCSLLAPVQRKARSFACFRGRAASPFAAVRQSGAWEASILPSCHVPFARRAGDCPPYPRPANVIVLALHCPRAVQAIRWSCRGRASTPCEPRRRVERLAR